MKNIFVRGALTDSWSVLPKVKIYMLEEDKFLSIRIEMTICIDAKQAFVLLSDMSRRHEWDEHSG